MQQWNAWAGKQQIYFFVLKKTNLNLHINNPCYS